MTIKIKTSGTSYYNDTGTNGFNLYNSSAISVAGRKNHILTVAIQVRWESATSGEPTRVLKARKPDATEVELIERVGDMTWAYNAESKEYEGNYVGILDIDSIEELNRIRFSSSKNFLTLGHAFYWMLDAQPVSNTHEQTFINVDNYSFTDTTTRQGCVQVSANWRGLESGSTIPSSDCTKTYAGHYRRSLTTVGSLQGGVQYGGTETFKAVGAIYEPVYYGMRFA